VLTEGLTPRIVSHSILPVAASNARKRVSRPTLSGLPNAKANCPLTYDVARPRSREKKIRGRRWAR
jgi:hypothetical protein